MTTVSASSAAQLVNPPKVEPKAGAHKQRLLDQISAQAQAGSLSATDASALTSAVQDIDQAMSSASGTSGTSGARLDPAQAKSRMDGLVDAEVTKGTLTSDQATTLKTLLSSQKGGGHGGEQGGVGGAGGPPPGPPPAGAADAGSTDATSATGAASSSTTSASDLLAGFLKQLQDAQANQASGYGASGSGTPKGSQAAVFDFKV